MREIHRILEVIRSEESSGDAMALATVVNLRGSGYRRPGARMLICADGRRIGTLSGGCLEADVAERARRVINSRAATIACYDGRSEIDPITEMGCNGTVEILIEPMTRAARESLQFIAAFDRNRGRGAVATVFRTEGTTSVRATERIYLREGQAVQGQISDRGIATAAEIRLRQVTLNGSAVVDTIDSTDGLGSVKALIEPIQPRIALVLYGGGYDAVPLARLAHTLGWHVTVCDHRDSLLTPERFPMADQLISLSHPDDLVHDDRTAVVLMTHSYSRDMAVLRSLSGSGVGYIGLLGPRKRAEQMYADLSEDGITLDLDWRRRFHGPTGLDIGAETADEIALSILAEIQAVLSSRKGGSLRDVHGAIHPVVPNIKSAAHAA